MTEVDLDAARQARAEALGSAPTVRLGGRAFTLPAALPSIVMVGLARAGRGDLDGYEEALAALFGDQVDEVLALGLAVDDLEVIIERAYLESPPEASGSGQ